MQRTSLIGVLVSGLIGVFVNGFWSYEVMAQTPVTTIINPSFEIGTPGTVVGSPWTQISGLGPMYVTSGAGLSPGDPTSAQSGSNFLTANRLAPDPDDPTDNSRGVYQNVDLTPYASIIDVGSQQMDLSYYFNANDSQDAAVVSYNFLNSG